uniref:Putative lipocalin n=1 Tax=Rhipicephalus microplus TaxID=6941 RepID=A0A6G5A4N7_RHIMP
MQRLAKRSFSFTVAFMLLAARLTSADDSGQTESVTGEGQSQQNAQEESRTVNIVEFYGSSKIIWIFGMEDSKYSCMVDVVHETTNTSTSFARYHQDVKSVFQSRELIGTFKEVDGDSCNAMDVCPAGAESQRKRAKSWKSLEVMLRVSNDGNCGFFQVKYSNSPNDKRVRGTRRIEEKVEYNLRVQNTLVKLTDAVKKVETCFQELKVSYESQQNAEKKKYNYQKQYHNARKPVRATGNAEQQFDHNKPSVLL